MLRSGTLKIDCATKMLTPNGGVNVPMLRLVTTMMPKWIGSTPMASDIGSSSGVSTRIADAVSMKQPTISRNTLMTSSTIQGRSSSCSMKPTAARGTPLVVRSHENTPATATIRKICAVRYIDDDRDVPELAPADLAVDRHGDERDIDAGRAGGLGRREHAAVEPAEDQHRRADRPAALASAPP